MTGIELVLAALAAGAGAGITEATSDVIRNAIARFRERLASRVERRHARDVLEANHTDPQTWRDLLSDDLLIYEASKDPEVTTMARSLLELLGQTPVGKYRIDVRSVQGVQIGDGNTQTNTFTA